MTYNPKFESLELFSVIGGYMGMYLGVSIVAVYDFAELAVGSIYKFTKKRKNSKKKMKNQKKISTWMGLEKFPEHSSANFRKRKILSSPKIRNIY
ncbi:uncharacterized protein CDAR_53711 [Caerostris darwini]|uniref:Uncharacterized protein n=1 Tax=Caerostris darwini TaxID=1538125 RepID=A0AAV4VQT6_9ARAC|nr:uncharacterized protein CDAR_53711 [Caerostris darwini]